MEPFSLHIEGHATIQGRELIRLAVPAEDMMQSFAYRHLVPAQEQKVTVMGRFRPGGEAATISTATPVKIPAGGTTSVQVSVPTGPMMTKIEYQLSEPPDGITIKTVTPLGRESEITLQADAAKVKPGTKGNLIVMVFAQGPAASGNENAGPAARRIPLGALPAIPFEIVGP
jgi:hypothetical protein